MFIYTYIYIHIYLYTLVMYYFIHYIIRIQYKKKSLSYIRNHDRVALLNELKKDRVKVCFRIGKRLLSGWESSEVAWSIISAIRCISN